MEKRIALVTTGGLGCMGKSKNTRAIFDHFFKLCGNDHCLVYNDSAVFFPYNQDAFKEAQQKNVFGNGILIIGNIKRDKTTGGLIYTAGNDSIIYHKIEERKAFYHACVYELMRIGYPPSVVLNEGYFNMQSYRWFNYDEWDKNVFDCIATHIGLYDDFETFNKHQMENRKRSHANSKKFLENFDEKMKSRQSTFESNKKKFGLILNMLKEKQKLHPDIYPIVKQIPFLYGKNYIAETLYEITNLSIFKELI